MPFPIEKAPTKNITTTDGGVDISELLNYPVRSLVFEGGDTVKDLSNTVSDACICLQDNNIPYNVLISDCGKRIFLFPQVIRLTTLILAPRKYFLAFVFQTYSCISSITRAYVCVVQTKVGL